MKDQKDRFPWGVPTRSNIDGGDLEQSDQVIPEGVYAQHEMFFPILGVIDAVYFGDDPNNDSNSIRNPESTNVQSHKFLGDLESEYYQRSMKRTSTLGSRLEARVKVISGPSGSGTFYENVPICIGFGGVHNYGYVVPNATTNTGERGFRGTEDGDYCLIHFISGDQMSPVITNIWPNPLNMKDTATIGDREIAYARMSGSELIVDKEGNLVVDARNANSKTVVDPASGAYVTNPGDGTAGDISVVTASDIFIGAGFPRDGQSEGSLPKGTAVLRASKDVEVYSTVNSVKLYSTYELYDDDGKVFKDEKGNITNRVDIQGPRGSLRRAARQHDSVRMTSGNSGNLFKYLKKLHTSLDAMATTLMTSLDPGAAAAGEVLAGFADSINPPTYQYGKITTGSDYCYVAGKGDASDVGFDESGIKNSLGEGIDSETLEEFKESCFNDATVDVVAQNNPAITEVEPKTLSATTSALKTAQKSLEKIPGGQPAATALGIATPKIVALLYATFATGSSPGMDNINLPSGSSLRRRCRCRRDGWCDRSAMATVNSEYSIFLWLSSREQKLRGISYRANTPPENIPQNPARQGAASTYGRHTQTRRPLLRDGLVPGCRVIGTNSSTLTDPSVCVLRLLRRSLQERFGYGQSWVTSLPRGCYHGLSDVTPEGTAEKGKIIRGKRGKAYSRLKIIPN
jgi:hypothetical protein